MVIGFYKSLNSSIVAPENSLGLINSMITFTKLGQSGNVTITNHNHFGLAGIKLDK